MDKKFGIKREMRSFLMPRDPSVDRRFRPCPEKQLRLFDEAISETSDNSTDSSDTESDYTKNTEEEGSSIDPGELETGPQVFLRLRPVDIPSKLYVISDCGNVLITSAANENSANNVSRMEKHYSFTSIFDSQVGQRDVYDKCVGPRITEEECVTIMAYGTSGSGKTYTLLGDNVRAGVVPRALENIFTLYDRSVYTTPKLKLINARVLILEDDVMLQEMQMRRQMLALCPDITSQHKRLQQVISGDHEFMEKPMDGVSVMIWVSFVEIYNELVYDLLTMAPRQATVGVPPRKNLKIVCNKGQVFIKGLTSIFVKSSEEALKLLRLGQQRLTYASTAVNANSSRSHCIFTVDVLKYHRSGVTTQNSYKFCDLAGSERVDKTGTIGSRLREAQSINTSLMVLGRCLDAASSTKKKGTADVIPYRDSKLTMLLQAALLGKERLAMIVTVTPLDKYYEENLNVLNFASIAKNILFKQPLVKQHHARYSAFVDYTQSSVAQDKEYIEELEAQNISLRAEVDQLKYDHVLKMQLQEERLRKEITDMFQETIETNLKKSDERHEKKIQMLNREFEAKLASLKRKYEEQIEDLEDEIEELKAPNSDIEIIEDD
ncbi:kinesin-like protein subito [Drosophila grimshawi]|uniref:GH19853 n=1 Tax=Drosophila grimshawi TaxID=7222 RepID=B4J9I7_DROGR|nr:kinesin-like protein subito [Drosophila grimshawi]EDW02494.1 GH19853 [Drosophila grimshawi]